MPACLKTAAFGYDGKGQHKLDVRSKTPSACGRSIGHQEAVVETFVDFEREVSVVAARGLDGDVRALRRDREHASRTTSSTCRSRRRACPTPSRREAVEITRAIMEALDYVGVLCVEFFLTRDGRLLVNELAPRPHNSGHFTFDACVTSQFEQQVRAVCGLPLGIDGAAAAGGDGESARRPVGGRRARLGGGAARSRT